jgi:hypothetical protein
MPGYRELATTVSGSVAELVREAAALEREGDLAGALRRYEEALAEQLTTQKEMPSFLCGRLATLYRRLGLHDDEVELLERHRDSQTSDKARSRFHARLSKARSLADRKRRQESGALASIRAIRGGESGRRRRPARTRATLERTDAARALLQALREREAELPSPALTEAVARFCASITITHGVEDLVAALKATIEAGGRPEELEPEQWKERGSLAVPQCVATYFEERTA